MKATPLWKERQKENKLMDTMIYREPAFSYIYTNLPTSDEEIEEIIYTIRDRNLRAVSYGSENNN